ncbi:MAG: hypothetical protein GPI96_10505 [Microcystis aeruginosa BS13-02]|jgi:hypothetical protein|nr:hypothetical protein [Microcystis aeruginosa BS13-02]
MKKELSSKQVDYWEEEFNCLLKKINADVNAILGLSVTSQWDGEKFTSSIMAPLEKNLKIIEHWYITQRNSAIGNIEDSEAQSGWLINETSSHLAHIKILVGSFNSVAADVVRYLNSHPGYQRFLTAMTLDLIPNLLNEFTSMLFGGDGNTFETGEAKEVRLLLQRTKEAEDNIRAAVDLLSNDVSVIITKKRKTEIGK